MCYYYKDRDFLIFQQNFYIEFYLKTFGKYDDIHERLYDEYFKRLNSGENVEYFFDEIKN